MEFPANWPPALTSYLTQNFGSLTELETLRGLSQAQVYRAEFAGLAVIVKASLQPKEAQFYSQVAGFLRGLGVSLPETYWQGYATPLYWLVLENIPQALPQERWEADPAVLAVLRRLHNASLPPTLVLNDLYRPAWTEEMTQAALSCLSSEVSREIAPILIKWQAHYQYLFDPTCPISGDPNPLNWGIRPDGSPVLFDWERFTFANPALDVAIIVPGLAEYARFRKVAAAYLETENAARLESFTREIAVAKLWSVVEFLSMYAGGNQDLAPTVERLGPLIPAWVKVLNQNLST